jgi:CRISPR-associated protein Csb1
MAFSIENLTSAVDQDAAFRSRQRLQPVGGAGDKIFPPTYPGEGREGPQHIFEQRRIGSGTVVTALLDSVQSSANRHEEALLSLARARSIELPYLSVDFSGTAVPEIGEITSLDAPHRIFDAILRDSLLNGQPLMQSDMGKALQLANAANASSIFEHSPAALLFGAWNSTGEGGGLGAKFPRAFVSEIVAIDVPAKPNEDGTFTNHGRRPGSRIDPLSVLRDVEIYKAPKGSLEWDVEERKGWKKARPSEVNHGNIAPSVTPLGITMEYALHTVVIGFAGLRRLRFGDEPRSRAARTLLAALGLLAFYAVQKSGYALRSRCELVAETQQPLQLVAADGSTKDIELSFELARDLYGAAVSAARKAGFNYDAEPLKLTPQEKLIKIVSRSRELALAGKGGEAEDLTGAGV